MEIKKVEQRVEEKETMDGKRKKGKIRVIETVWMMMKETAWVKQMVKMIETEMVKMIETEMVKMIVPEIIWMIVKKNHPMTY